MSLTRIHRSILAIALPAIVSNITTPLLSLVDVAIVGHIGNAVYIGAIAVGGAIFNMLYWLFGFLRMGSSGLTAQAFGANNNSEINLVLWRGLFIAATAGVAMIALAVPIADTMLNFMADSDAVAAPARRYFLIAIWGAPAVLGTFTLSGWLLGMQNTKATMVVALTTNIVNILISLVLVFGLKMDIGGVATGTMVAQWVGFITAVAIIHRKYGARVSQFINDNGKSLKLLATHIFQKSGLKRFFGINAFIFLRTLCLVAVTLWFTHAGALESTLVLAANTLLMQLFMFFSYFMDGFAFAGEAVCGKYHGANDIARLRASVGGIFKWGLGTAVLFTAIYFLAGEWIIRLLTDDGEVLSTAAFYLPWAVSVPLCGMAAFAWDGIFIGITRVRPLFLSVATGAIAYFALYFTLQPTLGNHGLWIAFLTYLLLRALILTLAYRRS